MLKNISYCLGFQGVKGLFYKRDHYLTYLSHFSDVLCYFWVEESRDLLDEKREENSNFFRVFYQCFTYPNF